MLSQVQRVSAKSESGVAECDDVDDDAGGDKVDKTDRPFKVDDDDIGIAGQVNILVSSSRELLEGQKQVSGQW